MGKNIQYIHKNIENEAITKSNQIILSINVYIPSSNNRDTKGII